MMMSIIEGDEKIPFWTRVTKPRTESCAENKCDDREKLSSVLVVGSLNPKSSGF